MAAKDCPNCRLTNPGSAQRCDCGYDFNAGQVDALVLATQRVERGRRIELVVGGFFMILLGLGLSFAVSLAGKAGFILFYGLVVAGLVSMIRGFMKRR